MRCPHVLDLTSLKKFFEKNNLYLSYRICVENLPPDMSWQELRQVGEDYGPSITFARTWRKHDDYAGNTIYCGYY